MYAYDFFMKQNYTYFTLVQPFSNFFCISKVITGKAGAEGRGKVITNANLLVIANSQYGKCMVQMITTDSEHGVLC